MILSIRAVFNPKQKSKHSKLVKVSHVSYLGLTSYRGGLSLVVVGRRGSGGGGGGGGGRSRMRLVDYDYSISYGVSMRYGQ